MIGAGVISLLAGVGVLVLMVAGAGWRPVWASMVMVMLGASLVVAGAAMTVGVS